VNKCLECGAETNNPKFCSRSHAATYNNKRRPGPNFIDEIGNVYGNLTVIERAHNDFWGGAAWNVRCSCGSIVRMTGKRLRGGKTTICDECSTPRIKEKFTIDGAYDLYKQYRYNAGVRRLVFDITPREFEEITQENCLYCGGDPGMFASGFVGNGIDRLDNTLGYIISNVVSCCSICNKMKSKLTQDAFVDHCNKVARHNHS